MSDLSRYAQPLTGEEWERIHNHIADGPATTYVDTEEFPGLIMFQGGAINPRCYLEIMEDDEPWETFSNCAISD